MSSGPLDDLPPNPIMTDALEQALHPHTTESYYVGLLLRLPPPSLEGPWIVPFWDWMDAVKLALMHDIREANTAGFDGGVAEAVVNTRFKRYIKWLKQADGIHGALVNILKRHGL